MKSLIGSRIQKIKEVSDRVFSIELYSEGERKYLFIIPDKGLFLSNKDYQAEKLSDLCKVMRKRLIGKRVKEIRQHEFDRIVEIKVDDHVLILEFFGRGNVILLDKDRKIILALGMRSWKDRVIKPKREYKYPPSAINPFKLTKNQLEGYFGKKEVVKVLAKDFGFGGEIAEKICEKLGVDKKSKKVNIEKLFSLLKNITKEFKELESANDQLKFDFERDLKENKTRPVKKTERKYQKIRDKQIKKLEELKKRKIEYEKRIEIIHENYSEFDYVLKRSMELRKQNLDWEEIKKRLKVKVHPKETKLTFKDIPLDFRKSLNENLQDYFKKLKQTKKKIDGVEKAIGELKDKGIREVEITRKKKKKDVKEWYDKFRWFESSDGFLVVAGKDARTNELLIRKYMKKNDLVFHADITGSPFVLIKNPEAKEIPRRTLDEVAQFCASYSKAWKIGITVADVYYIKPDQVKKEGGLPAGSFMIYGKRSWIRRIELKLAIGVVDNCIVYGPESSVVKKTKDYVLIVPGEENIHEFFRRRFGNLSEDIKRVIPYGKCGVIED